jgi:uncharacterized protein with PIN domain
MKETTRKAPAFIADAHLGKLARHLRFGSWYTLYFPDIADAALLALARAQGRILLTRDRGIHPGRGVRLHRLQARDLPPALAELAAAYDLATTFRPFTRCMVCNATLKSVEAAAIRERVPPRVYESFHSFKTCPNCHRIYWKGDHYQRMIREWERAFQTSQTTNAITSY